MKKVIVLAFWEITRITRSKPTLMTVLSIPLFALILRLAIPVLHIEHAFTFLTIIFAVSLMCVRHYADKHSGFFLGLESTPAVGMITYSAMALSGVAVMLVQSMLFRVISSLF